MQRPAVKMSVPAAPPSTSSVPARPNVSAALRRQPPSISTPAGPMSSQSRRPVGRAGDGDGPEGCRSPHSRRSGDGAAPTYPCIIRSHQVRLGSDGGGTKLARSRMCSNTVRSNRGAGQATSAHCSRRSDVPAIGGLTPFETANEMAFRSSVTNCSRRLTQIAIVAASPSSTSAAYSTNKPSSSEARSTILNLLCWFTTTVFSERSSETATLATSIGLACASRISSTRSVARMLIRTQVSRQRPPGWAAGFQSRTLLLATSPVPG